MTKLIFKNYGGSYQLKIQDAQDLEKIQFLDEVHWAATSIPTSSLNCDHAFTACVDTDKNGRIMSGELKTAQSWLFRLLSNRSRLPEGTDVLQLKHIDTTHPEGQKLRATAEIILANLKITDAAEISLAQVRDVQNIMARATNNGDGIIPAEAASNPDAAQFITTVMKTVGSSLDASGKPGIGGEQLKEFFDETKSYLAWKEKCKIPEGKDTTDVMPWGTYTHHANELIAGIESKIEQFFAQCSMVRFDERSAVQMQLRKKELEEIDFTDTSILDARIKNSPLALLNPEGILHLKETINPFYADGLHELHKNVLKRALGNFTKKITAHDWEKIKKIFRPYRAWLESKQGVKVEKVDTDLLYRYINGHYKKLLNELIAKDLSVSDELNEIHNLEKLILYQRWLMELTNNFVSFAGLYNPDHRSLFEMGTLVINARKMTFAMTVQDRHTHKTIAEQSYMYLLYVEITGRTNKDIKFEIVVPVTSGNADGLHVGKRGIFFTTDNLQWDAKILDIVVNPISYWESVKAPFQQFTGFIRKQIDKFTKSRQTQVETTLDTSSGSGMARDLMLGGSIAIAALGSAFAYITKALSQVKPGHVVAAFAGLIVIVLLPGIIIGFSKIRKRNMSVFLEASGLAVNIKMRLTSALGQLFTYTPPLPKDARKERKDALVQIIRELGYNSFSSRKLVTIVLIIILIVVSAVFFLLRNT